jgi:hypothetical protein
MSGSLGLDPVHATLLAGTATLNCAGGIIGGGTAGVAKDTLLFGAHIATSAGLATLTIAGLRNSAGSPTNWVFTGSTAADVLVELPAPVLNDAAAFTFTPSVANAITVFTRAYTGAGA